MKQNVYSIKCLLLVLLFSNISNLLYATAYTTSKAGDLDNKLNWTPVPENFTTQGDTWNINQHMTVTNSWAVTGNVTISEGGSITDLGNSIYFGGHLTNNAESSYIATGTAVFNSQFPQVIGGTEVVIFNNLTRTNDGLSFNANCIINGNFIAKSFIVDNSNTLSFGGDFSVTTGNNLFTGTSVFIGKSQQTVTGNPEFFDLEIKNTSGLIFNSNETIKGNLTLNECTLNDAGNTVAIAGSIFGTGKETGTGGIIITGSSATISGATIDNLTLDNPKGFSLTGNTTINGVLNFKAGSLSLGSYTLTLGGTVTGLDATKFITGSESASLVINSPVALGTLYFNQTIPGTTNNVATLAMNSAEGSLTLGNKLNISSNLDIKAGTISDGGNAISLSGNITGSGKESGAGGIILNGTATSISGVSIGKLTLNNATEFTLSGSPTISNALVFNSGTLSIGNNTLTLNGTVSGMSATSYFKGGPNANLNIGNAGEINTFYFDQTQDGVSNNIAVMNILGSGYAIVFL